MQQTLDDRYRILSPLGKGGMGEVFLGEHIRIGRQVAIKILSPSLAESDGFLARFEREAVAAGRLDHPNCVPVTDSGYLKDGTAYLVMELVNGRSLGSLLEQEGPQLDPVRSLRIIRHVLMGLGHAHEVGIVHRDIKPDNIMLCERDGDTDFARVLDFGIAKLRNSDAENHLTLTQAGIMIGTPNYLSPEQALGEQTDHRSDLYSCSVLLFEMLCGRPPFVANSPIGVLTKHASAAVPRLWDIAPHLGKYPALDALVQRGLAKERSDRFQNAANYLGEIDRVLSAITTQGPALPPARVELPGESIPEMGPTMLGPTLDKRRIQIRRILIAVALLCAIVIALALLPKDNSAIAVDTDAALAKYETQLRKGKTCKIRLQAVKHMLALGDKRAIPSLKKARYRMRGGMLGIGKENTNRCLRAEAIRAIKQLKQSR